MSKLSIPRSFAFALILSQLVSGISLASDPPNAEISKLIEEVLKPEGVSNARVLHAIEKTPRHEFIPSNLRPQAYFDRSLPIGHEQTISSPLIVAVMTEQIDPQSNEKVLEIGTGSGYQAAVLSPLAAEVYTIEIVPELGHRAEHTLHRLGYKNVHVRVGDGYLGWPEKQPFDKIIVTCSPEKIPQALVDQLREGGRMVIPVGERYQQSLYLLEKHEGQMVQKSMRPTLFVPMTGAAESKRVVKPNGKSPALVNGNFETSRTDDQDFIPGWYYGRGAQLTTIEPGEGKQCLQFDNQVPGRPSYLLQGFAVDGHFVHELTVSTMVHAINIKHGLSVDELPLISLTFYDEQRRELNAVWLGPFRSATDWTTVSESFKVPAATREAIVRVGMFGATGRTQFDDLRVELTAPAPPTP